MDKNSFWDRLSNKSKEKVEEFLQDYAGSDGTMGRIFELYEEGATEANMTVEEYLKEMSPDDYVNVCYDSYIDRV